MECKIFNRNPSGMPIQGATLPGASDHLRSPRAKPHLYWAKITKVYGVPALRFFQALLIIPFLIFESPSGYHHGQVPNVLKSKKVKKVSHHRSRAHFTPSNSSLNGDLEHPDKTPGCHDEIRGISTGWGFSSHCAKLTDIPPVQPTILPVPWQGDIASGKSPISHGGMHHVPSERIWTPS